MNDSRTDERHARKGSRMFFQCTTSPLFTLLRPFLTLEDLTYLRMSCIHCYRHINTYFPLNTILVKKVEDKTRKMIKTVYFWRVTTYPNSGVVVLALLRREFQYSHKIARDCVAFNVSPLDETIFTSKVDNNDFVKQLCKKTKCNEKWSIFQPSNMYLDTCSTDVLARYGH
jgi:hypothetical protein